MHDPDHIYRLIARKLAGEASAEELLALEQAMKEDPAIGFQLEVMMAVWKPQTSETTGEAISIDRLMKKVKATTRIQAPVIAEQPKRKEWFASLVNTFGMLVHFFMISRRILFRQKAFSVTNIAGLAVGMAAAILILLWIQNEWTYDDFHSKKDRIYEVYNRARFDGRLETWNNTPQPLGPALLAGYPQIEDAVRVNEVAAFVFHAGEQHLETHGYIADPGFLTMFDFPLLQGNAQTALNERHSVVLTNTMAKKLFGNENALGKTIRVDSSANFTVTGILKDLPNNTQFNFEYLIPWSYMKEVHWDREVWEENSISTLVLLKPGVSEQTANARIRNIPKAHSTKISIEVFLHPLSKWRLWSRFDNGRVVGGRIEIVRLFGIIAVFILLIACINYMNLSTARSEKRGREVGIRKVMGARKASLVGQFLTESVLIAFLACMIALLIVYLGLPSFNQLTNKQLFIPYHHPDFWWGVIGFTLLTGIIAGIYPAFYLSDFKPIRVLKGYLKLPARFFQPRKVLVVLQFSFAIVLILCTMIIYRQLAYTQQRNAGYQQDNLAFVFAKGDVLKNYEIIKNELLKSGAVTGITLTNSPITSIWNTEGSYRWPGRDSNTHLGFATFYADNNFAKTMGLTILAGRDIDIHKYPTDSSAILINESAAKAMNFTDPIGKTATSRDGNWHVVGVVNDFIVVSPFDWIRPTVIQGPGPKSWFGTVTFRLNSEYTTEDNLARIKAVFTKYNPDYPFLYYFADKQYADKFYEQQQTGKLAAIFAGLTIFISCLGLFGLATYTVESRIKEIGIRKVLGASATRITTLLSRDFLQLVMISFVIASPIAWWSMHQWLQEFPYRVGISWWIFAVTGLLSVLIAVLTVSYQSIKAAIADPVTALRNE